MTREATALHMPKRKNHMSIRSPAGTSSLTAGLSIFRTCQICCKYADELGSCSWSALCAASGRPTNHFNFVQDAWTGNGVGHQKFKECRSSEYISSAPAHAAGGPKLHRVIFRVECCRAGGGEIQLSVRPMIGECR